jgi:hypothetical protein
LRIDEARKLVDVCLRSANGGDEAAVGVMTALLLGLRASEVTDRVVRDLDDNGRLLWIEFGQDATLEANAEMPPAGARARGKLRAMGSYVALGDSMSIDLYPDSDAQTRLGIAETGLRAASLLFRNVDRVWPEHAGLDLTTRFPSLTLENWTSDGAMIPTVSDELATVAAPDATIAVLEAPMATARAARQRVRRSQRPRRARRWLAATKEHSSGASGPRVPRAQRSRSGSSSRPQSRPGGGGDRPTAGRRRGAVRARWRGGRRRGRARWGGGRRVTWRGRAG